MGEVWLAEDADGERVAVKAMRGTLADGTAALERFAREIEVLAGLDHPGIVRALSGLQQEGETWFYAMELVLGRSLQALLEAGGPLEPVHAAQLTCELLDALGEAHAQRVVHRDVKPANVLVDRSGQARLTDFGLARAVDRSRLTAAETVLGTPAYMSPEQADGKEATAQSDLYAVGVLLFELLGGRPPFVAESPVALLRLHLDRPAPDVRGLAPAVPAGLADVVAQALEKDPRARFPDAAAMQDAIQRAAGGERPEQAAHATTMVLQARVSNLGETRTAIEPPPAGATPLPAKAAPQPPPRRGSLLPALSLALAAGSLLLGGLWWAGTRPPAPEPGTPVETQPEVPDASPQVAATTSDAPASPVGDPVLLELRDGSRLAVWLVSIEDGVLDCVEREGGAPRSFHASEVSRWEHEE
jgi:eukaryotic-like serine/threonine-protein kinase